MIGIERNSYCDYWRAIIVTHTSTRDCLAVVTLQLVAYNFFAMLSFTLSYSLKEYESNKK